jgi:hypothetical protein
MNLHKMIAELQAEKERLDEAILALERLSAGKPKRRSKQGRTGRRESDESTLHGPATTSRHANN